MCLHISLSNLDLLDTSNHDKLYSDSCDYIDLEDCAEIFQGTRDLSVMEINVWGLASKQFELLSVLRSITKMNQVDVVILAETWLTKESESRIKIPGYEYFGEVRQHKKGGGIGLLIRQNLNYKKRPDLHFSSEVCENCFIELKGIKRNIIIGAIYRTPNLDAKQFVKEYDQICKNMHAEKGKDTIIGLDHNLDLLKHHQHRHTQSFLELMLENAQFPCITRPTRISHNSATLIDNLLLSVNLIGKQTSSIIVSDLSDHLPCLTLIQDCMITCNSKYECYK